MAEDKNDEIQIDLGRVFAYIWYRIWIVAICLILGAGFGYAVSSVAKKDIYSADATYVVYYVGSDVNDALTYQTRVSTVLGNCVAFVRANKFERQIADYIKNSEEDIYKNISVSATDISKIITYDYTTDENNTTITVTSRSSDPDVTYAVLTAITDNLEDYITENYKMSKEAALKFSLINNIDKPTAPVKDNSVIVYTLVGGLGATLVCMIVLACIVIFDKRVKNEDDLIDKYNIAVLGSVPNFEDKDLNKREGY